MKAVGRPEPQFDATLARLGIFPRGEQTDVQARLDGIAACLEEWLQTKNSGSPTHTNEAAPTGMETASRKRKDIEHGQCTLSA